MFEHFRQPLIPRPLFLRRVARAALISISIITLSLALGMAGYHYIAGLGWLDSFLNASMILTGMGPVNPMNSAGAKIFASLYALFSGVAFLTMVAVLFAPVIHRLFHKFHLDIVDEPEEKS